jgi:hypothetical protein
MDSAVDTYVLDSFCGIYQSLEKTQRDKNTSFLQAYLSDARSWYKTAIPRRL